MTCEDRGVGERWKLTHFVRAHVLDLRKKYSRLTDAQKAQLTKELKADHENKTTIVRTNPMAIKKDVDATFNGMVAEVHNRAVLYDLDLVLTLRDGTVVVHLSASLRARLLHGRT